MTTKTTISKFQTTLWIQNIARIIFRFALNVTYFAFSILILLTLGFITYLSSPIATTPTLWIPKGSATGIITHLNKNGYDLNPIDLHLMTTLGKPQSGWIAIGTTNLSRIDFIYKLVTAKASTKEVTLIPGETSVVFFEEIGRKFSLDPLKLEAEYLALSPYKEGGIFAETYHIPRGIDEKALMKFLVGQSEKRYLALSKELLQTYNTTEWNRILTIASIIQKEAANNNEMPLVASVIYNRLKKNMRLQMDGTLNYGKYSHIKITPERIKEDESRFNTYRHRGIPPTPVCSVSVEAMRAAINPAKSDYLYFMKNSSGTHDFTVDFTDHRNNIKKVKTLQKSPKVPPLKQQKPTPSQ